jgi:hypothetical protein
VDAIAESARALRERGLLRARHLFLRNQKHSR